MKRPEWVKSLVAQGLSKEEVIEKIKEGNAAEGINPVPEETFAKLNYNKIVNPKPKKSKLKMPEDQVEDPSVISG